MIVDTSAILAVLFKEPDAETYLRALASAPSCRMSAVNWVEAGVIVDTRGDARLRSELDDLLIASRIVVEPVSLLQSQVARRAYAQYGKGRHPAALNFGDCFAYALAVVNGEPLLYKGDDFGRTDVLRA